MTLKRIDVLITKNKNGMAPFLIIKELDYLLHLGYRNEHHLEGIRASNEAVEQLVKAYETREELELQIEAAKKKLKEKGLEDFSGLVAFKAIGRASMLQKKQKTKERINNAIDEACEQMLILNCASTEKCAKACYNAVRFKNILYEVFEVKDDKETT